MSKRVMLILFFCLSFLMAKAPENALHKTNAYSGSKTLSNVSNWSCWVFDNGQSAHSPAGSSGAYYPSGTGTAIYQDGLMWGGKVVSGGSGVWDRILVGGQNYNVGTVPGWVIRGGDPNDAVVADPNDPAVRVYRIRSDYQNIPDRELLEDAALQNETYTSLVTDEMKQAIIDQYEKDWNEWPVDRGAPYIDKDHDGTYTAGIDEPGYANADQVIWFVVNDFDRTKTIALLGSEPIGLELQVTIWAYNDKDSRFGQTIFKSYKLINKSNYFVKDMYVTQWSDPDIGSASNDFVGCDTVLGLGYAYNGDENDADYDCYGLVPPAAGYVLLQGPMVPSPGDKAVFDLKDVSGSKNLSMTSFGWFAASSALDDPSLGDYVGTLQYYNMMRGYKPTEDSIPIPWHLGNDDSKPTTKFPLYGDPTVPGASEVDGTEYYFPPGDRRLCVSSGPFEFRPGYCNEVIFALVGGKGVDHLAAISDLKSNALLAKLLYENKFGNVSRAPEAPDVNSRYFENTVLLEWGSNHERVSLTENFTIAGYEFEGYNVYQLPNATAGLDDAVRIATFDVVNDIKIFNDTRYLEEYGVTGEIPVAFGDDTGIRRYMKIDWDYLNNCRLYEGKTYYFGVTSYNQNLNDDRMGLKMYESDLIVHTVTLQEQLPGNMLSAYVGQSDLEVVQTTGNGEGIVIVKVIDPYAVTGDDYSVRFNLNSDSSEVLFSVWDETLGIPVSEGNEIIRDTLIYRGAPIVDGLEISVISEGEGLKTVAQYDADDNLVDEKVSICNMSMGPPGYVFSNIGGDCNRDPEFEDFDRFNVRGSDDIEFDFTDSSVAWQYSTGACLDKKVPFAMYRRPNGSETKERLFIEIFDEGWGDTSVENGLGTWDITGIDGIFSELAYEPIYAYVGPTPYDPSKEAEYLAADHIEQAPSNTGWGVYTYDNNPGYPIFTDGLIVDYYENSTNPTMNYIGYPAGYKVIFGTYKSFNTRDEFSFSTAGYEPVSSDSLLLAAVDRINVFPNPYYGFKEYNEYVTFTHLPPKATIKIFNLAGTHITTLEHVNANSQFEIWYLGNHQNIRVGSGMYIAHIDMPDLGKEKILKFMIVRGGYY